MTTAFCGCCVVAIGCPNCLPTTFTLPLPAVIVSGSVKPSTVCRSTVFALSLTTVNSTNWVTKGNDGGLDGSVATGSDGPCGPNSVEVAVAAETSVTFAVAFDPGEIEIDCVNVPVGGV